MSVAVNEQVVSENEPVNGRPDQTGIALKPMPNGIDFANIYVKELARP
jgi:hypothetical protein